MRAMATTSQARMAVATILLGLMVLSCYQHKRYGLEVKPSYDKRDGDLVTFVLGKYFPRERTTNVSGALLSTDSLFELNVRYRREGSSPADFEMKLDSVVVSLADLPSVDQSEFNIRTPAPRTSSLRMSERDITAGPIVIPPDYKSRLEVRFVLSVYDTCTDTLIFRRPYHLAVDLSED